MNGLGQSQCCALGSLPTSLTSLLASCSPFCQPNPQSLTFSASDDAYLFSPVAPPPTAAPSCVTALEHVNGTVLFQQVRQTVEGMAVVQWQLDCQRLWHLGIQYCGCAAVQLDVDWKQYVERLGWRQLS